MNELLAELDLIYNYQVHELGVIWDVKVNGIGLI